MTAYSVLLDASNIAFTMAGGARTWRFERVEQVREAWLRKAPNDRVHAVIDAGVLRGLSDRSRAARAEKDGWLEVAHGDADDVILREADRYAAAIVSRDKFVQARRDYPWLQGCQDRIWWIYTLHGRLSLRHRPLEVAGEDAIDAAIRKKAAKAGLAVGDDREWRCAAPTGRCDHAGGSITSEMVRRAGDTWYCRYCQYPAREVLAAAPEPPESPRRCR